MLALFVEVQVEELIAQYLKAASLFLSNVATFSKSEFSGW